MDVQIYPKSLEGEPHVFGSNGCRPSATRSSNGKLVVDVDEQLNDEQCKIYRQVVGTLPCLAVDVDRRDVWLGVYWCLNRLKTPAVEVGEGREGGGWGEGGKGGKGRGEREGRGGEGGEEEGGEEGGWGGGGGGKGRGGGSLMAGDGPATGSGNGKGLVLIVV